jgi:uncharacterized coiled-coil protein SlyX
MLGFSIIKTVKLQEMQQAIANKDAEIARLKLEVKTISEKLSKFDRKRVNGRFCKTN